MAVRLDDPSVIASRDPGGMLAMVSALPDQCDEALARSRALRVPASALECASILVCGMGGSAVAGEFLAGVVDDPVADRVRVHRGWGLPAWVQPEHLVVVSSYSGNTPETLSAYGAARERRCAVVAISSGGELGRRAAKDGELLVPLPAGMPPRAAVAALFFPLFRLAVELGLARPDEEDTGLPSLLRTEAAGYAPAESRATNRAIRLAEHLAGRFPLIHSGTALTHAVALRFVSQLAENAKRLAIRSEYPELTHNEVVAWDGDPAFLARLAVVEFMDAGEPRGVGVARDGVEELARQRGAAILRIAGTGATRLARLWSLVLLVDFASVYLALLEDRNPSAIEPIEWLKRRVAAELKGNLSS